MPADTLIVVLGAGLVGRAAVTYAAAHPAVSRIIVADRNLEAASQAASLAGDRGQSQGVDVTDAQALADLFGHCDAVLNCVGPFYRFGPPVLAAAIRAGIPYLDVCDDWEPTLDMLEQGEAAVTAGVTAVIGQGASPGTANLVAAAVMAACPDATSLLTGWSLSDDPGDAAGAANDHWLHQSTGTIRMLRDGAMVDEPPLREFEVRYPGLPPRPVFTVGHPEAVTLPRTFRELQTCINVMTLPRALAATLQRAAHAVDHEGLSIQEAATRVLRDHVPGSLDEWPEYPGVWAIAEGPRGRAAARLTDYGTMVDIGKVTAAPLIAGLDLILNGKGNGPGVLTPEAAFAPADYFEALGRVAGVEGPMLDLVSE